MRLPSSFAMLPAVLALAMGLSSCAEKAAKDEDDATKTKSKNKGEKSEDEGDDESGDDDGADKADDTDDETSTDTSDSTDLKTTSWTRENHPFDLCEKGLKGPYAELNDFKSLIAELCTPDVLAELRKEDNVYKGGLTNKFVKRDTEVSGNQATVHFLSSAVVEAKASDYFALLKLESAQPEDFRDIAKYDLHVTLSESEIDGNTTKFRYRNADSSTAVEFRGESHFVTFGQNRAFAVASKLTESLETMKSMTGIVVLNGLTENTTEILTIEIAVLDADNQDANKIDGYFYDQAKDEQRRMFDNAEDAHKAPDLLKKN